MRAKTELMEQMAAPENLQAAWRAVRGNIPRFRRARSAGPDRVTLDDFERDLPAQLADLRQLLLNGRYDPQSPSVFSMQKPGGGTRPIAVLNVADRVAQRSAQQVLEPLLEPVFLPCSFGFRPGRSTRDAVYCANRLRASGYPWVVDGDISACFDSLDHQLLMNKVEHFVRDARMLDLLHKWLNLGILNGEPVQTQPDAFSRQAEKVAGGLRRGLGWLVEACRQEPWDAYRGDAYSSGYAGSRWEAPLQALAGSFHSSEPEEDALVYREDDGREPRERSVQRQHLRQLAFSGMALGAGWARDTLLQAAPTLLASIKPVVGPLLLKQGLLLGGGAAGVAVGAMVAAVLVLQRAPAGQAGVMQGSAISPLLANLYLHSFDQSITRSGFRMVRYADDWVILCPDQDGAEKAYKRAEATLARLKLKINPAKTRILAPADPLQWLGQTIKG